MSFPPYEIYKDAGIEWLPIIPGHWSCQRLKAVATCNDEVLAEASPPEYEIEYVEISGVEIGRVVETAVVRFQDAPSRARRRVRSGDIIVSTVRTYLRAIAPIIDPPNNLIVSTGFAVVRPRSVISGFIGYLFQSELVIARIISRSVGVSYPAINASEMMNIEVPVPPLSEQSTIAAFLDRETAKIDALVREQQWLIELLREKRQAVISHAVTKGLDPNAPMRNSGVEWLGQVPKHWEVKALRAVASVVRGASPRPAGDPKYFGGGFIPWVTVAEVTKDEACDLWETDESLTEEGARLSRTFSAGTLIYSNSGATLGVPKLLRVAACANDGVIGFERLEPAVYCYFLYYFLFSITNTIREMIRQGSGQPNLNTEIVKAIRVAVPPIAEQIQIVQNIEGMREKFDALSREANRTIALLQERRSALISAAVTGKIDVHGLVPAEADAA